MKFITDVWLLWLLNTLLQFGVVFHIYRSSSLRKQFPRFALYLLLSLIVTGLQIAIRNFFPERKNLYPEIYMAWAYSASIFEFLAIQELCKRALERFPAIRTASIRVLLAFWAVLILVGTGWYVYLASTPSEKMPVLYAAIRYRDAASLGFTLFILLFLAFVAWMPVPLSRNILRHSFLFAGFFLSLALSHFVAQLGGKEIQVTLANYISLGGTALVFVLWIGFVRSSDDSTLNTPKGSLNREEAEILLARLHELNETLSRSGPKVLR